MPVSADAAKGSLEAYLLVIESSDHYTSYLLFSFKCISYVFHYNSKYFNRIIPNLLPKGECWKIICNSKPIKI